MQSLSIKFLIILFFFSISIYSNQVRIDSLKTIQKIVVDSIKIVGNEKTKDFIILRELTFSIGDSVNNKILHFNRERIFSLGLFNRVEVGVDSLSHSKVIISVEETWYIYPIPFWSIEKNSVKNLTVGLDLLWNNFRGRNETLQFLFGLGYDPFFSIQYVNPALSYDDKIGISIGLSYYKVRNKNEEVKKLVAMDFNFRMMRISIGLFKRINQFNLIGGSIGFDYTQNEFERAKFVMASKSLIDRSPFISGYYFYDTRDLKQFPQEGKYFFINFIHKGFNLYNVSYNILKTDFRFYQKLFYDFILKERIFNRETFGEKIPTYDYSYLGYEEKIRGYNNVYFEGKNSLLTSIELSYPILNEWNFSLDLPLIPKSLTIARIGIYASAFFDAGSSFDKFSLLKITKLSSGYGFGISILVLPFETFRVEYSFNKFGKGEFVIANRYSF